MPAPTECRALAGVPSGLVAATAPARDADPLALSRSVALPLTVYWEAGGEAVAGLGVAREEAAQTAAEAWELVARLWRQDGISWVGHPARPPGPWFGGMAFDLDAAPAGPWRGFPVARWTLPEILLWRRSGQTFVTVVGVAAADALERRAREVALATEPERTSPPRRPARRARGSFEKWELLVGAALRAISAGELSKVVLARPIDVEAPAPFDVPAVLDALRSEAPTCATFLFSGREGAAFVGATPELLCRVRGGELETMALGATRLGAPGDGEALAWARDKERREHAVIVDAIASALRPCCAKLDVPEAPRVRELPRLAHLETPIRASLRPGTGMAEVLRALHPTPAVGGSPRDEALAFLREREELERGWYAGAIGWVAPGAAELRVALRCALVKGSWARVFSGAGIVAGSTAEGEWRETEVKSTLVLDALGGVDGA